MESFTNRLAGETSPYLLQHARNPVQWFPWSDEALDRARREDKPILLSVGYSACHWCHVMAHESFEDPQTAEVMNALFVNIKVDREERPDLDKIYQTAHYFLTQRSGGWPLTMFLTPDQVPFFGGTYFPKEPRHGLPAFTDLLRRVERFYRDHREDVEKQNRSVVEVLDRVIPRGKLDEAVLNTSPLDQARYELEQSFDPEYGGFGAAPKFPHPTQLERLLRHYAATASGGHPDDSGLDIVRHSLTRMARGGIYDQLGGGFCRYSVDERWMIPHFEKMLYDNGLLLPLYAQAWAVTGDPMFKRVVEQTASWVMRDMQSSEGGYHSSLDADSEGEEGKYYVWDRQEMRSLLSEQQYRLIEQRFGLDRAANFEGKWHLYVARTSAQVAQATGMPEPEVDQAIDEATAKLLRVREARVPPGRDDKALTSWNALMIKGMSVAAQHLGRADLLDSAERALDFVRRELWQGERLLATYKDGRAHLPAYLDDYAFLIDAILTFAQSRVRPDDLAFATALGDILVDRFEDHAHGGFFFTGEDHERLIMRPKTLADDATPSGNGVAAFALGRLGHLLGDSRYLDVAERALKGAWESVLQAPSAHCSMLLALEEYLFPTETVVMRGEPDVLARWQQRATAPYAPRRLAVAIPEQAQSLPGLLAERRALGTTTAYVCRGHACDAPITEFGELDRVLAKSEVRREA